MGEKKLRVLMHHTGFSQRETDAAIAGHKAWDEPDADALKPGDEVGIRGVKLCGARLIVPNGDGADLRESMEPLDFVTDFGNWRILVDPSLVRKVRHG